MGGETLEENIFFKGKGCSIERSTFFSYHWPLAAAALVSAFRFLPPLVNEKSFSRKNLSAAEKEEVRGWKSEAFLKKRS